MSPPDSSPWPVHLCVGSGLEAGWPGSRCAASRTINDEKRREFSTPRAARNRLATADLKRVTSARSPLGNAAGSPLGNAFSADRCGARFFEVIGRPGLGQNRRSIGTTSSTTRPSRTSPVATICIQWYFAIGARLHRSHDLVGGVKRREGGGW